MAVISFPFINALANRVANCITGDIEKLEVTVFGTKTNWQSKYDRPFKAHYANDLVERLRGFDSTANNTFEIELRKYEKRAEDYSNDPQKKGRPLTTFVMRDDPQNKTEETNAPEPAVVDDTEDDALTAELKAILSDDIPVPSKPDPRTTPAKRSATNAPTTETRESWKKLDTSSDTNPDAQAALVQLMAALTPKAQPINEDEVRRIARDEAKKTLNPTIVMIHNATTDIQIDMGVQHSQFPVLIKTLQTKFPVWLPGPAGSGKTTAAKNAATALEVPFHHTGAVDNVYQLLGFIDAGGTYHRTTFREAYENGGVFLWDEVDASNPAALVAFNAALENGECVFPDAVIPKHDDCYFIAAANTYGSGATHEYVGRTKIDAATVDRFVMLDWHYDEILERAIAGDNDWTKYVQSVRKAVKAAGVKHLVTPRASIRGNALLAAGINRDEVIKMTVRKGMSDDQWRTVSNNIGSR